MFTSIFRKAAAKVVLGGTLLAGGMTFVAPLADAQAPASRQFALSPRAQQVLSNILHNATPHTQQLVWNALLKIGPERAEAQLVPLSGVSPYDMQASLKVYGSILQGLPIQYHQTFVNGLFQASPEEERFAIQVMRQVIKNNEQASRLFAEGQDALRRQGENFLCSLGPNPCFIVRYQDYR